MTARLHAGLSQNGLARRVRETGHKLGYPNECNRANVSRWENGTQPQAHYVLILENVLGAPADALGFHGIDRDRMLMDAGLDLATPIPEVSAKGYGPLTGIWLSKYEYPSSSRGGVFNASHHVLILQRGAHLTVRSLPRQHSRLSLDLTVNGQWIKGTWAEVTSPAGYYAGAAYDGTIGMFLDQTGRRMSGRWLGYGRDPGELNDGNWSFTLVDDKTDRATIESWDSAPEDKAAD
jgi:hypothetical protein